MLFGDIFTCIIFTDTLTNAINLKLLMSKMLCCVRLFLLLCFIETFYNCEPHIVHFSTIFGMFDLRELEANTTNRFPSEQHSPLHSHMFPAHWSRSLQRLDTLATLFGDEIFLTNSLFCHILLVPRRNWPFPVSSAVNCPDFAVTVTSQPSLVLYMQDKTEGTAPADTLCRI